MLVCGVVVMLVFVVCEGAPRSELTAGECDHQLLPPPTLPGSSGPVSTVMQGPPLRQDATTTPAGTGDKEEGGTPPRVVHESASDASPAPPWGVGQDLLSGDKLEDEDPPTHQEAATLSQGIAYHAHGDIVRAQRRSDMGISHPQ